MLSHVSHFEGSEVEPKHWLKSQFSLKNGPKNPVLNDPGEVL
jgi:hypothetical protein